MRPAVIQQFNLSLQYQIDSHTAVQAGYVGQTGQHLAVPIWINQFTTDDTCSGLSGSAQDTCYQRIDPFYALVGAPGNSNPAAALSNTRHRGRFQTTTLSRSHCNVTCRRDWSSWLTIPTVSR